MKRLIQKLLTSKSNPWQLGLTLTGAFLGLIIVMLGLQTYRILNTLMQEKDLLAGDYIVISKKVGLLNTITGSQPSFSEAEMKEVGGIEGIDETGAFHAGTFQASIRLKGSFAEMAGAGFNTQIFFESLPSQFVDAEPGTWKWNEGSAWVPIIIPADYISLYNTAFAQSQGLPVIPESLIRSADLEIYISGKGKSESFPGRIAGFSKRINSILVPQEFLNYGNEKFGSGARPKPSRLILHSKNPASPALAAALTEKGYELNEEKLRSSRLNHLLQTLLSVVSAVGVLIVFLALMGFIQYNQLMAYRSAYEIQTLHWLGYSLRDITMPYIRFTFNSLLTTWLLSSGAVYLIQYLFGQFLEKRGFDLQMPDLMWPILLGFVISLLMAAGSSLAAARQVKCLSA